jgi:hypothetical protein
MRLWLLTKLWMFPKRLAHGLSNSELVKMLLSRNSVNVFLSLALIQMFPR